MSDLSLSIACVVQVVGAFGWFEVIEELADAAPDGGDGPFVGLAQQGLELGEDHLDRVQVRAVWRQEQQVRARRTNGAAHGDALVAAEIVEHDDVTWAQGWSEELLDPGAEQDAIDRPVEHAGRDDAVVTQTGEEGHGGPVAVRRTGHQALAARGAAVQAGHVGLGPGFIDKHQAVRVDLALMAPPAFALAADVGPLLFGGAQAFF